jgi:holo-[acyl-carrier protein] synthase
MIAGIGIDVVDVARIAAMLEGKQERMLARLFTEAEASYAMERATPALHLAARLAAKEAAFKALAGSDEARLIGWREVEVVPRAGNSPTLRFTGRADARLREMEVRQVWVTLTHTDLTAAAVVILERA